MAKHLCILPGQQDKAKALLKADARTEARDRLGQTPLHIAKTAAIVEVLLKIGANIEARDLGGETPLHVATILGKTDVIKALLAEGADGKAKDNRGKNPFDIAMYYGHITNTEAYRLLNEAQYD